MYTSNVQTTYAQLHLTKFECQLCTPCTRQRFLTQSNDENNTGVTILYYKMYPVLRVTPDREIRRVYYLWLSAISCSLADFSLCGWWIRPVKSWYLGQWPSIDGHQVISSGTYIKNRTRAKVCTKRQCKMFDSADALMQRTLLHASLCITTITYCAALCTAPVQTCCMASLANHIF